MWEGRDGQSHVLRVICRGELGLETLTNTRGGEEGRQDPAAVQSGGRVHRFDRFQDPENPAVHLAVWFGYSAIRTCLRISKFQTARKCGRRLGASRRGRLTQCVRLHYRHLTKKDCLSKDSSAIRNCGVSRQVSRTRPSDQHKSVHVKKESRIFRQLRSCSLLGHSDSLVKR